jgi:aldehyde:ferredoxin oxidoreductase
MKGNSFALAGKILRVDLTSARVWTEPTARYAEEWIGGRGINVWILHNEVKPWVTPFDPANRLIFGTGVLVGTLAPAATRLTIEAKSPMTGGLGSANACGFFSPELKFAGYDHIVFQGRARRPVYLWIDDDRVEIMDASHLWGKTTWEADDLIKEDIGDDKIQTACIGPAGENLVRAACIITNRARAAGRCGLGAVMGSKNLKAVAVRGSGAIEVSHPARFMSEVDKAWGKIRRCPASKGMIAHGTHGGSLETNNFSFLPVRNFQDDYWDSENLEILKTEVFEKEYEVGRVGYLACPLSCSHFYKITHGPYAGVSCEGFEANDAWNFAGKLGIDYPPALIKLHAICSEYGLDQDNASQAIAWAFECYQRGIITDKDTNGLHLEWGDHGYTRRRE